MRPGRSVARSAISVNLPKAAPLKCPETSEYRYGIPASFLDKGGFIGEEIKQSNVKPEYVWFDGTSYVYNVGETIQPDAQGVYHMAKANGAAFDGKSSIVPIKRHFTVMPLHESGKIVPPAIMWMFMTGKFDVAVQKGMEEQGMTGKYSYG